MVCLAYGKLSQHPLSFPKKALAYPSFLPFHLTSKILQGHLICLWPYINLAKLGSDAT
jgi:hypothetical protein